jgi:hypothetical protein
MKTQILRFLAIVLFLLYTYSGFIGWLNQWNHANTRYQEVQTLAQLSFAVLSLVIVGFLIVNRTLHNFLELGFTIAFGVAGGMAPVVWGRQSILLGITGGTVAILIALGSIWLARRGKRSSHAKRAEVVDAH